MPLPLIELAPHFLEVAQLAPLGVPSTRGGPGPGPGALLQEADASQEDSRPLRVLLRSGERDVRYVARSAVRRSIVASVIDRRRVDDFADASQQERLDAFRYAAMSLRLPRDNRRYSPTASVSDRRRYQPSSSFHTIFGTQAWIRVGSKAHHSVGVCFRRKARREVLFARHKHGGSHRRPRRVESSWISC